MCFPKKKGKEEKHQSTVLGYKNELCTQQKALIWMAPESDPKFSVLYFVDFHKFSWTFKVGLKDGGLLKRFPRLF